MTHSYMITLFLTFSIDDGKVYVFKSASSSLRHLGSGAAEVWMLAAPSRCFFGVLLGSLSRRKR